MMDWRAESIFSITLGESIMMDFSIFPFSIMDFSHTGGRGDAR